MEPGSGNLVVQRVEDVWVPQDHICGIHLAVTLLLKPSSVD